MAQRNCKISKEEGFKENEPDRSLGEKTNELISLLEMAYSKGIEVTRGRRKVGLSETRISNGCKQIKELIKILTPLC